MHHSRLCSLQIDCNVDDIDAAARFWAAALGCPVDMDHPGSRDSYRQLATPPDQPMIQLQRVATKAACTSTSKPTTSKRKSRALKNSARRSSSASVAGW